MKSPTLALMLVAGLIVAAPPSVQAASVSVSAASGRQVTSDLVDLAGREDTFDLSYTIRDTAGTTTVERVTGHSLGMVIATAGFASTEYEAVAVARPDGSEILMTRAQVLDAGLAPDGTPVVLADGDGVRFIRPSRGGEDVNVADAFTAGATLNIRLLDKPLVELDASATPTRAKLRELVRFEATASGPELPENLEFTWFFDDGRSETGRTVSHRFTKAGRYRVMIRATRPHENVGFTASVLVRVGESKSSVKRSGGGTSNNADAPDHGSGKGSSKSAPVTTPKQTRQREKSAAEKEPAARATGARRQVSGSLMSVTTVPGTAVIKPQVPASSLAAARAGQINPSQTSATATGIRGLLAALVVTAGLLLQQRSVRRYGR